MKLMNVLACLGLALTANSIHANGWVTCMSVKTGDIKMTEVEKGETEKVACKKLGSDFVPQYLKFRK